MLRLFNTLTRKKEIFKSLYDPKGKPSASYGAGKQVGLYTCGPTVYNFQHIGNYRTYIFEDVLRRALQENGYKVKHVMNVTDVGHLVSDEDEGEDKIEKGAKREGKSVWEIAKFYTADFLANLKKINVKKADVLAPATKNIKEQVALIEQLLKKGLAYETDKAIYFDVSKFKNYTKLSGQKLKEKITGARDEVVIDRQKRNPQDFALWFKLVGRFKNHVMRWKSPWGAGFPGWHIECSAISTKYLGQPFDIHAGGVDHIGVHHTNEIAQSEGAWGKPLAKFWIHGEHLLVDNQKMAKSAGNFYTLRDLEKKGFNPLSFRYLVLGTHYRSKLNFTWKSLEAAARATNNIREIFTKPILGSRTSEDDSEDSKSVNIQKIKAYGVKFKNALNDDLNTPKALAVLWQLVKDNRVSTKDKKTLLLRFDKVLGLGFDKIKPQKTSKIPAKIKELAAEREKFRVNAQFIQADRLRKEIERLGYSVEDTTVGPIVRRKSQTLNPKS